MARFVQNAVNKSKKRGRNWNNLICDLSIFVIIIAHITHQVATLLKRSKFLCFLVLEADHSVINFVIAFDLCDAISNEFVLHCINLLFESILLASLSFQLPSLPLITRLPNKDQYGILLFCWVEDWPLLVFR